MSSDEDIKIINDESDIEDVAYKLSDSNGLTSCSEFNLENLNTALLKKYIEISHEILKIHRLAIQGNLIAMQSNNLAMKNSQALSETILKTINSNPINLKDRAKSKAGTSKSESVVENKRPEASSSKSGIKVYSNKRLIDKKLTCVVKRLPKNFQLQAKANQRPEKFKAETQEFQCTQCQLKFRLKFMLIRHMKSFHVPEEIKDTSVTKEPEFDFPAVSNATNEDDKNNNYICVNIAENKNDDATPPNQNEKKVNKSCSVVLSRISSVNNEKKRKIAKKALLLKKK